MQRRWWPAALCVALTVGLTAAAQAQETIKIGGIGPLSGGGTAWGLAAQRGMEIAIEEINAAGGFKAEGKTFKAAVGWEAGCNHSETPQEVDWSDKDKVYRVRGARNMPQNGSGPLAEFSCPTCHNPLRVRARIDRRIAAS